MLSPTDNLREELLRLQLCTPAELDECAAEVRRLAGDLPAFDSCWLDVLVARRLLTPWQAEHLELQSPLSMMQGEYRIRRSLGERTWEAETTDRQRRAVLARIASTDDETEHRVSRAERLVKQVSGISREMRLSVCAPVDIIEGPDFNIWLVSPFVDGWRADDLVIRGGRMPETVVREIGFRLISALQVLEANGLTHGDIALRNLLIMHDGRPVLVDPFTERMLRPSFGFRSNLQLRNVTHCAPELVGTGRAHGSASDIYSLGTVLWHLLTARPTFLSADPVRFLMQARDEDVEDARCWVPDCPDELAHVLHAMTRRRPELRPQTFAELIDLWPAVERSDERAVRRLLSQLPDRRESRPLRTNRLRRTLRNLGWTGVGAAAFAAMGLAGDVIPLPLNINQGTVATTDLTAQTTDVPAAPVADVLPLPLPTANGVLELIAGQQYRAVDLRHPGQLRTHVTGNGAAVILPADGQPWLIQAAQVELSDLIVKAETSSSAVVAVQAPVVSLNRCLIQQTGQGTGLQWSSSGSGTTVLQLSNSVLRGGRQAIRTTSAPDRFECRQVLFFDTTSVWRCDIDRSTQATVQLSNVTHVGGRSFADVVPSSASSSVSVQVTCGDSVLAPAEALIRFASASDQWTAADTTVAFFLPGRSGVTLIPADVPTAVWLDRSLKHMVQLPDSQTLAESLLVANMKFSSSDPEPSSLEAARLLDFDGPHKNDGLPGVDFDQLPDFTLTPQ